MGTLYKRNLYLHPYLSETAKHLFLIASKKMVGFCPANDTQQIAPTEMLQEAIVNIYQLKNYIPTIMQATPMADVNSLFPVYYSLSYPTLLEGEPETGTLNRIMPDIRDIKMAIDTLFDKTPAHQQEKLSFLKEIDFSYFHTEDDMYHEINKSTIISEIDSRFLTLENRFKDRSFCASSSFWRGCVRIDKK